MSHVFSGEIAKFFGSLVFFVFWRSPLEESLGIWGGILISAGGVDFFFSFYLLGAPL